MFILLLPSENQISGSLSFPSSVTGQWAGVVATRARCPLWCAKSLWGNTTILVTHSELPNLWVPKASCFFSLAVPEMQLLQDYWLPNSSFYSQKPDGSQLIFLNIGSYILHIFFMYSVLLGASAFTGENICVVSSLKAWFLPSLYTWHVWNLTGQ